MIYGHQGHRGWSTGGLLASVIISAAAGAGLGLLLAPQRGSDARRRLAVFVNALRGPLERPTATAGRARTGPGTAGDPLDLADM